MSRLQSETTTTDTLGAELEIALPPRGDELAQDEEWVVVKTRQGWRKIRLHDYHEVFSVPGLYERWVYQILGCTSPAKIRALLESALEKAGQRPDSLEVLDLGAGNGCVAEELSRIGAGAFVGVDIHDEARDAAHRDRPGLYDDYIVGDLTALPAEQERTLDRHRFNCLTCVAALGFGDIPTEVFAEAYNRVADGGWIAFNVKTDFLDKTDTSGFAALIRSMISKGQLDVAEREVYPHRLSTEGDPLDYAAFIGRKRADIEPRQLEAANA